MFISIVKIYAIRPDSMSIYSTYFIKKVHICCIGLVKTIGILMKWSQTNETEEEQKQDDDLATED